MTAEWKPKAPQTPSPHIRDGIATIRAMVKWLHNDKTKKESTGYQFRFQEVVETHNNSDKKSSN